MWCGGSETAQPGFFWIASRRFLGWLVTDSPGARTWRVGTVVACSGLGVRYDRGRHVMPSSKVRWFWSIRVPERCHRGGCGGDDGLNPLPLVRPILITDQDRNSISRECRNLWSKSGQSIPVGMEIGGPVVRVLRSESRGRAHHGVDESLLAADVPEEQPAHRRPDHRRPTRPTMIK